jgi:hypothetical protein
MPDMLRPSSVFLGGVSLVSSISSICFLDLRVSGQRALAGSDGQDDLQAERVGTLKTA